MRIHHENKSYALWVVGFLGVVLLCSLWVGARLLIHNIRSSVFDRSHAIIIAVSPHAGVPTKYLVFDPQMQTVRSLTVTQPATIMPAEVTLSRDVSVSQPLHAWQLVHELQNASDGKLNTIDVISLYLFLRENPQIIQSSVDDIANLTVHTSPFIDTSLISENQSIQIVNASDTQGAGTRLAHVISLLGGNVVAVQTAVTPVLHTTLTVHMPSRYTALKMSRIIGETPTQSAENTIADVNIVLGQDWKEWTR